MHNIVLAVLLATQPVMKNHEVNPSQDAKWTKPSTTVLPAVKQVSFSEIYTDSSNNAYTFWSTTGDPIAVSGDTIVLAYRQFQTDGSGFIAITTTLDAGANWLSDQRINEDAGLLISGGRYPSAEVAEYPIASWAELNSSPGWGHPMVAAGDYSVTDIVVGVNPGDLGTHKSIAKRLPDGNIAVFGFGSGYQVYTYVFDPLNGTMVGTLDSLMLDDTTVAALYPTAVVPDYNNNKIWLLAFDLNVGYRAWAVDMNAIDSFVDYVDFPLPPVVECGFYSDTNGVHPDTIDVFNWYWLDGVILNDGTPVIATDMFKNHPEYAGLQQGIVIMRPDTTFYVLGPDSTLNVYYPQLAYDARNNKLFLLWEQMVESDTTLGYGRFEIYMMMSADGGYTWTAPEKVLGDTTFNPSLYQVSRNIVNNKLYLAYMTSSADPMVDVYGAIQLDNGNDLVMMYDHFGYIDVSNFSVSEKTNANKFLLSVKHNFNGVNVEFSLPVSTDVTASIVTADGRVLNTRTFKAHAGHNSVSLPVSTLRDGVYFVNVSAGSANATAKFIVTK